MIITDTITINDTEYTKHVSDSGLYIRCVETGEQFVEAVDPIDITGRTYEETEEAVPEKPEEPETQNPIMKAQPRRFHR